MQILFVLQNTPVPDIRTPDLDLADVSIPEGPGSFDLTVSLNERDGRLEGVFAYAPELYSEATIAGLVERVVRTIERLVATPTKVAAQCMKDGQCGS